MIENLLLNNWIMIFNISKASDKDAVTALINHFNYSIADINSYDELTELEKGFISRELWDKMVCN